MQVSTYLPILPKEPDPSGSNILDVAFLLMPGMVGPGFAGFPEQLRNLWCIYWCLSFRATS